MRMQATSTHSAKPFKPFTTKAFGNMPARRKGMHPFKKVLVVFALVVFGFLALSVYLSADTGKGLHDIMKMLFVFAIAGGFIYSLFRTPRRSVRSLLEDIDEKMEKQYEVLAAQEWFESRRHK